MRIERRECGECRVTAKATSRREDRYPREGNKPAKEYARFRGSENDGGPFCPKKLQRVGVPFVRMINSFA